MGISPSVCRRVPIARQTSQKQLDNIYFPIPNNLDNVLKSVKNVWLCKTCLFAYRNNIENIYILCTAPSLTEVFKTEYRAISGIGFRVSSRCNPQEHVEKVWSFIILSKLALTR